MKIFIVVIGLLILSGCLDSSVIGTYSLSGSTITLQDDGTYLYKPVDGFLQKGIYSINGTELQLTSAFGTSVILRITTTGLIDEDGDLWGKV